MAHLVAAGIALALAAQAVLADIPPLPLPQQCTGPAEGPMPRSDLNWPANQTKLAQELQNADKNKGVDLIFYGDSITWLFRGDDINGPNAVGDVDRQRGDVFRRHFGQYRTAIQAIPGDQSGNLLWRIMSGGEWPTQHMPKTVVILIGTNDLSYADCNDDEQEILDAATGIISRVTQIVTYIHSQSSKTKIVLLGVLPRGAQYWIWEQAFIWPNRYQKAIAAINAGYYALALSNPDYVKYLYCGEPYAYAYSIDSQLLGDGIHPSIPGLEKLAACIQQDVDEDMKYSSS